MVIRGVREKGESDGAKGKRNADREAESEVRGRGGRGWYGGGRMDTFLALKRDLTTHQYIPPLNALSFRCPVNGFPIVLIWPGYETHTGGNGAAAETGDWRP